MLDLNLFRKEPDAWLFTGVKPGERRQFASDDPAWKRVPSEDKEIEVEE
jgi:hypothetical protein